jgi:uncharacterized membrane protein
MAYGFHLSLGEETHACRPRVRRISSRDCLAALREGVGDFAAAPTYRASVGLFYALSGVVLSSLSSIGDALQLVFPLAAGFAIIGPFVAIGLYEMSRRREYGLEPRWRDAFAVAHSPALPSILALGLILCTIFAAWISAAEALYVQFFGPEPPDDAAAFLRDILTTDHGRLLLVVGGAVGFGFAALSLCISVVAFPLMLDRDLGVIPAIEASLRTAATNPGAVALWGFIVAAGLILGSLPLFFGLAVVLPILGHATWRFYRRAIEREPALELLVLTQPRATSAARGKSATQNSSTEGSWAR